MVKRTVERRKAQAAQAGKRAGKTSALQEERDRWTCAFDGASSDSSLALVRSGVHGHRLRIIDVHTGAQRSEFSTAVKIASLAWDWHQRPQAQVVLGTHGGQIHVYSPARNAVVRTLEGAHGSAAVVAVTCAAGSVFSLDAGGLLVQWDAGTGAAARQVRTGLGDARALAVSRDGQRAAVASHRIELWDLVTSSRVHAWPGHTAPVHTLLWAADETALVSAAHADRHVHVWDASAHTAAQPLAVLSADSDVAHVDVSPGGSVLAVGEDGVLAAWHQAAARAPPSSSLSSSGAAAGAAAQGARRRNDLGYGPDGVVRIQTAAGQPLPVLLARFSRLAASEGSVLLVRGGALRPLFETLDLADRDGQFAKELVLTREPQDNVLIPAAAAKSDAERQLAAQLHAYSDAAAAVTDPVAEGVRRAQAAAAEHQPDAPSLADRIRQLSVGAEPPAPGTTEAVVAGLRLGSGTLVRVLVQALHTADRAMLDTVLDNSARANVVRDTVLALPVPYTTPFLQQLFVRLQSTPSRAAQLLPWIRNTLALHSAYLTSVPSLVPQLAGFYQAIEARLETHQKLLRLSGRLELANTQIRARAHHMKEERQHQLDAQKQTAMKPLNIYHESEDDDENDNNNESSAELDPHTPVWRAVESTDNESHSEGEDAPENQWPEDEDDDDDDEEDGDEEAGDDKMEEDSSSEAEGSDDDDDDDDDQDDDDKV
ncbi:Small subunit (SSU) processome component [Coemansia javaensis]|uniref:Small subunit (SSU) processome component n=1 Tax=Coemansia javaensis TaxID=2761396 RepID=A0A9W8HAX6_9FUNG|nr:Small subunit (SSU) processome component [Coemansia javaensis]